MAQGHERDGQDRCLVGGQEGAGATGPAGRRNRQARVGILPNPNRLPQPPPHRLPLTGKWPPLRSSRRPGNGTDEPVEPSTALDSPEPGQAPAAGPDPGGSGGLRIDVDGLNRSIDRLGTSAPARVGFSDRILGPSERPRAAGVAAPPANPAEEHPPDTAAAAGTEVKVDDDPRRGLRGAWARWLRR